MIERPAGVLRGVIDGHGRFQPPFVAHHRGHALVIPALSAAGALPVVRGVSSKRFHVRRMAEQTLDAIGTHAPSCVLQPAVSVLFGTALPGARAVRSTSLMTPATHPEPGIRRAILFTGDMLGGVAMLLAIPAAILAIGIPIALVVRLLLWMTAQL